MTEGPTGEDPLKLPENTPPELEGSNTIHTDETILPQEPILKKMGERFHPDLGHRISVVSARLGKYIEKLAINERGKQTLNTVEQLRPQNQISKN